MKSKLPLSIWCHPSMGWRMKIPTDTDEFLNVHRTVHINNVDDDALRLGLFHFFFSHRWRDISSIIGNGEGSP